MSAPQGGVQTARTAGPNQSGYDPKRGRKKPPSNGQSRKPGRPSNQNVYIRPKSSRNDGGKTTYRRPRDGQRAASGPSSSHGPPDQVKSEQSLIFSQGQNQNPGLLRRLRGHKPHVYVKPTPNNEKSDNGELGSLFDDPSSYGFLAQSKSRAKRPVPRFMLSQPRMLITPEFKPNEWDKQNQEKMLEMEASNAGRDYQGIYEDFQKMRDAERKKMEELGLVDAENTTKDLNEAIVFQGTCLDMCPVFERVRRALENNVKSLEKDPVTNKISRERAVKAFSRPAAGQPPLMPSDVRPPHVLQKTLDYITENVLEQLPEAHSFIWDRTRSIRQDFIYQNFYGPEAIDCNERIVRIHLLSLHIMAGSDVEYSQQQELEQLNKALQTLTEIYQDVRNHGGLCPNEAEFRAYQLISHFRDPELEREVQTLPDEILKSKQVQLALRLRTLMSQNNVIERGYSNSVGALNFFVEFFRLVHHPETPFLLACLLETHFNEYRFYALKSMTRAYHTKGRAFLATSLQEMLGFDSIAELVSFVEYYEVDTFYEEDNLLVDLFNKEKLETKYKLNCYNDKPKLAQAYSEQLNVKSKGLRYKDFVNSGLSNADLQLKRTTQPIIALVPKKPIKASQASKAADSMTSVFGTFGLEPAKDLSQTSANNQTPSLFTFGLAPSSSQFGQPAQPSKGFGGFGLSSGFGSGFSLTPQSTLNVGSLNLEDFLKSQNGSAPKTDTKQQPTSAFGQAPAKVDTPAEAPKASITPKEPLIKSEEPVATDKAAPKVTFGAAVSYPFDSTAQPNKDLGFQPKVVDLKEEKAPALSSTPSLPALTKPSPSTEPAPPKFEPKPAPALPVVSTPSKITDLKNYPKAVQATFDDILAHVVDEELHKMLPRIIKYENRATERQKLIGGLADELYKAFLDEVTYESALRAQADNFLKKLAVKKTLQALRSSYEKKKASNSQRKQKLQELQSISFKRPLLKRVSLSSSMDGLFRKRVHHSPRNESFQHMSEKQLAIEDLWKPINLDKFVDTCASNIKAPNTIDIKCLMIVEDWALAYSKWLNTKFNLLVSEDGQFYRNTVTNSKIKLEIESLPSGNVLKESSFNHSAFLVFECGLADQKQAERYGSLQAKLERDGNILHKLFQICNRYCLYKVQVLLVLWDTQGVRLGPQEVKQLMRLEEIPKDIVQDLVLCDMSSSEESVSETLNKGMVRMSERFKGKLTARGIKKKAKLEAEMERRKRKEEEESRRMRTTEEAETTLRAKEAEALKRSEQSRQMGYLNKHINNLMDLSNASFRTAANTTRGFNTTFGNNTMLNLNNSFLNHDTTKDMSVLGSFGPNVSVLEESTPFGSPGGRNSRGPKKVDELRELTASIRARYKKSG